MHPPKFQNIPNRLCRTEHLSHLKMVHRLETNLFFEQALYLVLFASSAGGV
jgi:hypothetical protein